MAETTTDVLVAAYPDIEAAATDFDALAALVEDKQVEIEAAILITHAGDGAVNVRQTADHRGRKGVAWGGCVGVLVGLAAPPLLAATAVGAAGGGLIGRFVDKRLETEMHDKIGENLPPGSAGIIAAFDDRFRLAVEQALPGSPAKSIVQTDKKGIRALKDGLAEAMGKFVPDRTALPIPDKSFGGTMGRTFDKSVGDWSMIPGPKAPDGAPNVLLILIDDAGFGAPDTFGGGGLDTESDACRRDGPPLQRVPRDRGLLPDAGGDAHRSEPPPRRHGDDRRAPGPVPGYTGVRPRSCTGLPRILRENGYVTAGFGKWHLTPGGQQGPPAPSTTGRPAGASTTGTGS